MAFRELKGTGGSNWFKWPDRQYGLTFEGTFRGLATGEYQGRATFHAIFVDAKGVTTKVNTPTILRDKLGEAEPGMNLRITYVGDKEGKKRNAAKDFRVEVIGDFVPEAAPAQQPIAQAPPKSAAEIQAEQFQAFLAQQNAGADRAVKSEYETLVAKLRQKDPKGAGSIEGALTQIYPDAEQRTKALRDHLKAQGVA